MRISTLLLLSEAGPTAAAPPLLASAGDVFRSTVLDGSLLLAMPVALLAGLVSFASPCVLPLVPGYLSYMTGMTGAELEAGQAGQARQAAQAGSAGQVAQAGTAGTALQTRVARGRVLAGTALFVLGFSVVFVSAGALFGGLGAALAEHTAVLTRVLGVLTIVLGLAFLGLVPALGRELRLHRAPRWGLAGAPALGFLFGLGWTPCIGPTLGAVQTLAYDSASAGRGALLTAVYCVGLGLPFVLAGLAFRRALGAFAWVRARSVWVMRIGGGMLVLLGLLLVTGAWTELSIAMRTWVSGFTTAV